MLRVAALLALVARGDDGAAAVLAQLCAPADAPDGGAAPTVAERGGAGSKDSFKVALELDAPSVASPGLDSSRKNSDHRDENPLHGLPLASQLVEPHFDRLREVPRRPVYRFPFLGSCVMALQPAVTATLACAASRVFSAILGLQ